MCVNNHLVNKRNSITRQVCVCVCVCGCYKCAITSLNCRILLNKGDSLSIKDNINDKNENTSLIRPVVSTIS